MYRFNSILDDKNPLVRFTDAETSDVGMTVFRGLNSIIALRDFVSGGTTPSSMAL